MRNPFKLITLVAALAISLPALAGSKVFKDTSDYRDTKVLKGYLNVKFDTYATMHAEPKGTDCDWVMIDPSFKPEDIHKEQITFFPDSISRNGGWDAGYWGMYSLWYTNGLVTTFEAGMRTRGFNIQRPANPNGASQQAMTPVQAMMAQAYGMQAQPQAAPEKPRATEPPALSAIQARIENDRYDEDKKNVGVEEAAKRAEAREAKRVADWKAAQGQANSEAAEAAKPKNPEDMPGYVLVLYLTESKVNTATAFIPFVPVTNTTTGEFVLLHNGKPVMAGRHNSVGAYTGSAPKCGNALATAFDIKIK